MDASEREMLSSDWASAVLGGGTVGSGISGGFDCALSVWHLSPDHVVGAIVQGD
jgi:hypothetical protein